MQAKPKEFDCVAMKHEIQARLYEETRNMTREQEAEFTRKRAEEFGRLLAARPNAGKGNFKALFESLETEQAKRGNL